MSDRASGVTREEDIRTLGGGVLSPLSPPLTDKADSHPLYRADTVTKSDTPPSPVEKWNYTDIIAWLTELGFSQYKSKFNHHAITNGAILMQLTEEHLDKMGISIIGHRLSIVTGIDQLRRRSGLLPAARFVNIDYLLEELDEAKSRRSLKSYPKRIILIRHAESEGNIDNSLYATTPDAKLKITDKGREQAKKAGLELKELIGTESCGFYVSPFLRSKQTFEGIRAAFTNEQVLYEREDPRIREQEWGNYQVPEKMGQVMDERRSIGSFFYRFPTGESGADVFDRVSIFLESLYRDMGKGRCGQNAVIVSHGLFCRLFLTRFYHWPIEYFHRLWNLENCQLVVMEFQEDGYFKLTSKLKVDP
ncbi:PREDICTED: phosphoglycerate mutase-like protein AT74H isoform X3 [Amphimedon queenslandica]|uniref:SAM domain-containing protein n=1 Tax=Amphimedon queenslandica TaxID=400682 RepID=A0A1X7UIK3_AMPQE|nr:PREDICTED: phosphoglycerate mutase-like protein AT74H isoform X3 [Amphimedon queenslandica]|eukprot:XP_019853869.1 PREDICTED: phosphoglycerate mutase-like protein AT74H isoform X3 [Amphimedon queenslandica]